jgi:hypothetical protein
LYHSDARVRRANPAYFADGARGPTPIQLKTRIREVGRNSSPVSSNYHRGTSLRGSPAVIKVLATSSKTDQTSGILPNGRTTKEGIKVEMEPSQRSGECAFVNPVDVKLVADIIAECRMQASSIGVVAIPSCAALAGTSG